MKRIRKLNAEFRVFTQLPNYERKHGTELSFSTLAFWFNKYVSNKLSELLKSEV